MKDSISVVVCVKNGEQILERALISVVKNRPFEIIIVDGNSTDRTLEIAKKYTDKIYSDGGKGLAYARQIGVDNSQGEYIAFIDSDTELPNEDIFASMLRELKEQNWVAIHSQLIDPRCDKRYWEKGEDFHWKMQFNKVGERRYLGTIVCLICREVIQKYKFDSFFKGAAEDGDFYHRIGNEGYKFGVSSTVAYHYHRASFRQFISQRIWYGKGNARAIVKHKSVTLVFAPLGIALYGTWLCVRYRAIIFIPFYHIWALALFWGTLSGLVEVVNK